MKISDMFFRMYIQPALGCFLRAEEGMAKAAAKTAAGVGAGYGATAAGEGAQLNPFFSREMQAQHAYDPTQLNEMLTAAGAGIGGATGAAQTSATQQAATTGNASAATKSLDDIAREKMKAAAGVSEGIAGQDVQGALALRQQGAQGLQGLYGENVKGQLAAMGQESADINAATNASKTGWLQNTEQAIETGADVFAACPAEGSKYLMADGTEQPVETLRVGDEISGIDDEPQDIEEVQSDYTDTLRVVTADGHVLRNSFTHAYALPKGGFVVAARSLGKTIVTAEGKSKIVSVEPAGKAWVFNIITNGSHTYRADGVWSLGVGDAERHVAMNEWAKVGNKLMKEMSATV